MNPNPTDELQTTAEAAARIRRAPQTLRAWACNGVGPIEPIRTRPGAPLLWRKSDLDRLIRGEIGTANND